MTYRGRVQGGVVILENDAILPEGTEVKVDPVEQPVEKPAQSETTLGERMMKFAGKATGLPADASINHDHYLYGTPKR